MNFSERTEYYIELINNAITEYLPRLNAMSEQLEDAVSYAMTSKGKRIRPLLVLEFCRINGGNTKDATPFAVAAELIHNYSLIHDDLPAIDNDDMRRGRPTLHKMFDEGVAILAGDELINLAFEVVFEKTSSLSDGDILKAGKILARSSGIKGILGGQIADIKSEGKDIGEEELLTIHRKKTAALISACAMLGCVAAKADDKKVELAGKYGENLGLAFQIVDDILDVTADEKMLGKPVGSDFSLNKNTFVKVFGLEKSKKMAEEYTNNALSCLGSFKDNEFLKELTKLLLERKF